MSNRYLYIAVFFSAMLGAFVSAIIVLQFVDRKTYPPIDRSTSISEKQGQTKQLVSSSDSIYKIPEGLNFVKSAKGVIEGVVQVRVSYNGSFNSSAFDRFHRGQALSSGSGVILTHDGYIATNNHVIDDAGQVEIVLDDNRSYAAKVVGTDPTTDLALLKVNAENLTFVPYGDSDKVVPGQWVLAVGNPFDLNSTVTAGIVSAKARNIGILRDRSNLQIESFIQTDAAVNPGNSGGALVNLQGELIGINTAIATSTGSYSGYSFAVPVTLVRKVMDDLLEFGRVQRGLLGIRINDVSARLAEQEELSISNGVFVVAVNRNSGADEAGIKAGDVIIGIDGKEVTNVSELQELVARNRPGDEVSVTFMRDQYEETVLATLKNIEGEVSILPAVLKNEIEGASFETLSSDESDQLDLEGGVKITYLNEGKWTEAGITEGFIITKIDHIDIGNIEDLNQVLDQKKGSILVEGVSEDGTKGVFGINW